MKTTMKLAIAAAMLGCYSVAFAADVVDRTNVVAVVREAITQNQSAVLAIVQKYVKAQPKSACEIVKIAITETQADSKKVAAIVEVAALSAPDQMRHVAQCAMAVAPDAIADVQAVMAKLDSAAPQSPNPLDFPTNGEPVQVGPSPEGPGGAPYLPFFFPYQPPFVNPNPATDNDL